MEMRHHKLEIMLKDRKIGKSDRKIGSDFEKKKIGSENRIGHFFEIVPSLIMSVITIGIPNHLIPTIHFNFMNK